MKNIYFTAILSFIFPVVMLAQVKSVNTEKLDGNALIEQLLNERYQFNKGLIKHKVQPGTSPVAKSVLKNGKSVITFDEHDYVINNKKIVEIKGVLLSKTALAAITERLTQLDDLQQKCSETVNVEYRKDKRSLQYIKNIDRQYFSYLKQMSYLTANVAHHVRKPNASITIEMAMDKITIPALNINNIDEKEILFAEVK